MGRANVSRERRRLRPLDNALAGALVSHTNYPVGVIMFNAQIIRVVLDNIKTHTQSTLYYITVVDAHTHTHIHYHTSSTGVLTHIRTSSSVQIITWCECACLFQKYKIEIKRTSRYVMTHFCWRPRNESVACFFLCVAGWTSAVQENFFKD